MFWVVVVVVWLFFFCCFVVVVCLFVRFLLLLFFFCLFFFGGGGVFCFSLILCYWYCCLFVCVISGDIVFYLIGDHPNVQTSFVRLLLKRVSMAKKYHKILSQTHPWYREEVALQHKDKHLITII